ncbi:unnamed protein product, partial [marine sediment metagenome]
QINRKVETQSYRPKAIKLAKVAGLPKEMM